MSIFEFVSSYEDGGRIAENATLLSETILTKSDYLKELPETPGVAVMVPVNISEMVGTFNITILVDANRVKEIRPTCTTTVFT